MALLRLCSVLLSLFTALTWSASMRLPSFPLAVKTPYLSVWLPGHLSHDLPTATPEFWKGQPLTWIVMARIQSTTYCLLGCTGGRPGTVPAVQKSINFTSTHTYVTLEAGSTELTMDFFSPVDPIDHVRQSLPFSYLTVYAAHKNGTGVDVGLISAVDSTWLSTRGAPYATRETVNGSTIVTLDGYDGREFSQNANMALWGKVVLAAKSRDAEFPASSCQVGSAESLFGTFIESGRLGDSIGTMEHDSFAACSYTISSKKHYSSSTFAIGLYQDNEMQYFDGHKIEYYVGYFRSRVSNLKEAILFFLDDFKDALVDSYKFDQRIVDIGKVTSANYSDILEFTIRQSFAGQQVMILNSTLDTTHPYSFIKEISTDGNVNTLADLIPKALPVFHVLNPEYTRFMLEPVLRFSLNAWPLNHAVHDIGKSYPNATGETPCIEEFLPLDSTSVLLWMLYLYQSSTGDTELTLDYAPILQRYADYCARYGLYPVLQRSSVDALGSATNQSALSVSAAIALNAYGKMTGQANYSEIGIAMAERILEIGTDSNRTHLLTHYTDEDEAWVLMYPLAFDAWLRLDTFPASVYKMQSDWYSQHAYPFGVQYRHNIQYTLMEWLMWVAAVSSNTLRDHLINAVHMFLDQETKARESVPGPTQWRVVPGPDEGVWTHFSKAKSVIGSIFMIAAVQGGFEESVVPVRKPSALHLSVEPEANTLLAPEFTLPVPDLSELETEALLSDSSGIPYKLPKGASKRIDPSFLGLSFDTASFPIYAGNSTAPNLVSIDLIRNLVKLSGSTITVRVGGPEADYAVFDPIQFTTPLQRVDIDGHPRLSLGPSYFDGIKVLSTILRLDWIYQVPFAHYDNLWNAVQGTSKAMDAIPPSRLFALEIGHKANKYAGGSRPGSYDCQTYAAEFFRYKAKLRGNIERVGNQFQGLGLSHKDIGDLWTMEECYTVGIDAQDDLRSVSAHYSHFESTSELRSSGLPRHSDIVREHASFLPQVAYSAEVFPCHPFVISEASLVSADDRKADSKFQEENGLAIAMWNLDFLLYAMSKNVSRVLMHQSCNSTTSAWTPAGCYPSGTKKEGSKGGINAPYSSLTFVASFLNGAREFQVIPIQESENSVVYAGYEAGRLSKLAVVNYPPELDADTAFGSDGDVIELQLPFEVVGIEQRAYLDSATLATGDGMFISKRQRKRDAEQVPMKHEAQPAYELRDGRLSMMMNEGGAMLFDIR